jgi:hypothetical protein
MPEYKITTGLPNLPSTQDDKQFGLVLPLYNGVNALAKALSQAEGQVEFTQSELSQRNQIASLTTQNHRKLYALAPSALAFGKVVNLYLNAGKIEAQLADCTTAAKPAHGIVNNSAGIAAGQYGEILLIEGYTAGISGTTLGAYYYLSTAGLVSIARPVGAGKIVQPIGFGLGSLGFYVHISSFFQIL